MGQIRPYSSHPFSITSGSDLWGSNMMLLGVTIRTPPTTPCDGDRTGSAAPTVKTVKLEGPPRTHHAIGEILAAHLDEFDRRRALVLRVGGQHTADGRAVGTFILSVGRHHQNLKRSLPTKLIYNSPIRTRDALSAKPSGREGFWSCSGGLLSGTNSFCKDGHSQ